MAISETLVPLESILCTEELHRRPARAPDYATENRALLALTQALVDSPRTILRTLSDTVLALLKADSAGLSLLTQDEKRFHWPSIAGMWSPHVGGGTPREFGPSGDVLDCNAPLLFRRFERRYPYLIEATPLAEEGLLVPFYVGGRAVGTIWAIAHDARRKFDSEDLRQLESLGKFASAAYQATESLNNEQEFTRSIIDSSPDCINVLDLEGNLLSIHNGQALLGIDDIRPFLNKPWAFWEGSDRQAASAAVEAAAAGREGRFVGLFRTLRGESKWWDVAVSPMLDTYGKPSRLLAVLREVTERKRAEMNLEFLGSVTQDLAELTGLDKTMATIGAKIGAYLDLSLCAFVQIDESADRVVISHDWHRDDVPSLVGVHRLADFVGEEFIRAARAGETIVVSDTVVDPRTDPEIFAALKIASFICVPLIQDGQWRFALCLYHSAPYPWREDEIELTRELTARIWTRSERLRAEETLRQNEEHFRALFRFGPLAMYSCDSEGTIQEYNDAAAQLWGRAPRRGDTDQKFCGSLRLHLVDGGLLPHAKTPVAAVLKGEIPAAHDIEVVIERPDGSRITVIANIVPIKNAIGEITGAVNCFYDITERSRLEHQALEQAAKLADLDRRKDEFLAMLGHELRNPLAPIVSTLDLIRAKGGGQLSPELVLIERQVEHVRRLVDDLLDVTRITTGKAELQLQLLDIHAVVQAAVEAAQPLLSQRQHQLVCQVPEASLWVNGDPMRLTQVLGNLLINAAKYTEPCGSITVSACSAAGEVVLQVRDNGAGIDAKLLPQVFDLFEQGPVSIDRPRGGLGIGLSIVKSLVSLHGGSVTAESEGAGRGSVFTIRLPRASAMAPAVAAAAAPAMSAPGATHAGCILMVDDNRDGVDIMGELLADYGYEVHICYDPVEALAACETLHPRVVIVDIGLPVMDGYELATRIHARFPVKPPTIIAVTGYGQPQDRQRSTDARIYTHLTKPVRAATLVEHIQKAIG